MAAGKPIVAAMAALGIAAGPAAGGADDRGHDDRGLHLEWQEAGDAVALRVITSGTRPLHLRYDLSVTGQSRSQHSGQVTVRPGVPAVVASVSIAPAKGWRAVLDVSGDQTYRIEAQP
jgi:hypothetical protein